MNTYGQKIFVGKDKAGIRQHHFPHEYSNTLYDIYLHDFLLSDEYAYLKKSHKGDSISFSTFKLGALQCPCIREPTMRVCVDEIETGFNEILKSLQDR